jgi:queuosine precursor transporter
MVGAPKNACIEQSVDSILYSIFNLDTTPFDFLFYPMIQSIIRSKGTRLFIILAGIFIATTLIAEIIGVKIFSLEKTFGLLPLNAEVLGQTLSLNLSAGVVIWPVVFIMTDIINEYYGQKGVRFLSIFTAVLISFTFVVFVGAIELVPADFFVTSKTGSGITDMNMAYSSVLGQGGKIIIGSIAAFLLSQLIDVFTFHRIKRVTGEKKIWMRATGSTLVSQFIDSFVVLFIAFYIGSRINAAEGDFVWPFRLFIAVGCVNYAYKFIVAIAMTPVIYLVHYLIERYLGAELAAEMKAEAMAQ